MTLVKKYEKSKRPSSSDKKKLKTYKQKRTYNIVQKSVGF